MLTWVREHLERRRLADLDPKWCTLRGHRFLAPVSGEYGRPVRTCKRCGYQQKQVVLGNYMDGDFDYWVDITYREV